MKTEKPIRMFHNARTKAYWMKKFTRDQYYTETGLNDRPGYDAWLKEKVAKVTGLPVIA